MLLSNKLSCFSQQFGVLKYQLMGLEDICFVASYCLCHLRTEFAQLLDSGSDSLLQPLLLSLDLVKTDLCHLYRVMSRLIQSYWPNSNPRRDGHRCYCTTWQCTLAQHSKPH